MLLEAADRLDAEPRRTIVVEDAQAGVDAGRRGGFGLVLGIDRVGAAEELRERGADMVVPDLGELRVEVPDEGELEELMSRVMRGRARYRM